MVHSHTIHSHAVRNITLRMAIVLLAHHSAPFENSAGILFLSKTCLKSEIFNSFMNVELCGGTSESTTGSNANAFGESSDESNKFIIINNQF